MVTGRDGQSSPRAPDINADRTRATSAILDMTPPRWRNSRGSNKRGQACYFRKRRSIGNKRFMDMRIGIAGLGTIGREVARRIASRDSTPGVPGVTLGCVAARDETKARAWLDQEGIACPIVALEQFPGHADLALECAPAALLEDICRPM